MPRLPEFEIVNRMHATLEEAIADAGFSDVGVDREVRISEYIPPTIDGEFTDLSHIVDLLVYKRITNFPDELDNIDNIERWFPEKSIRVPIAVVEVKREQSFSEIFDSDFKFRNLGLWNYVQEFEETLAILASQVPFDERDNVEMGLNSRRGNFIMNTFSDPEDDGFWDETVEQILEHAENLTEETLIEIFSLSKIVADFNPEVFHFNEVLHSYQQNRQKLLIILLSVFFESHTNKLIGERFETLRDNDNAGGFYNNLSFKDTLDACRFFGVISDSEYGVIDKTRSARNKYAHDLGHYRQEDTYLEREGKVDEAVELYESFIGVKQSMTNH